MVGSVAAVIVHHRSYDTVGGVVKGLLLQGISADHIVVVDNSEEPLRRVEFRSLVSADVSIIFEQNLGYGAAVNAGFEYFRRNAGFNPEYLLVSTHESRPEPGAVAALVQALKERSKAAVAGPALISGVDPEFVWSAGGYLRRWSHIPSHYGHRQPSTFLDGKFSPEPRSWLDGAFLLYRWDDFQRWLMPERYFLYMEETDLHLNLVKSGREVLWVPTSRVWQDSNGIPPFYLARNLRLLFSAHENVFRRLVFVPLAVLRRVAADVVRRKDLSSLVPSIRGLLVGLPREQKRSSDSSHIVIVNPLGAALKHYESEVASVLSANGHSTSFSSTLEPSASGERPITWLLRYIRSVYDAKRLAGSRRSTLLVLWPVLGYWDVVLFRILGVRNVELVVHDPVPLVKAVGYSRWARRCAALLGRGVRIVAHSDRALRTIISEGSKPVVRLLPHPILEPIISESSTRKHKPLVRVVGQYKKDRDLEALKRIAEDLSGSATFEIHGRGWPDVEGWKVVQGFVEEERLTQLMAESAAIVIPYKNFFQSGIAVRSLELGVPPVGPKASVLGDMFGHDSKLLVEDGDHGFWVAAVKHALENGRQEAAVVGQSWRAHSIVAWSKWN